LLEIRPEAASDIEAVFRVECDAFGREKNARLADALRDAGKVVLSLVAVLDGEVVGHVVFSPMRIESGDAVHEAVALGPVAVSPGHQGEGVGSRLIETGLETLREAEYGAVFLLGHVSYYPRFGFRPAREFGVHYEDDRDSWMGLELRPGALAGVSGTARFAEQFEAAE
jgi:putative acetyltransferase